MRPTVEYILKSFRDTGKRHIILTGPKGCGKTTRFIEIAKFLAPDGLPGFTSHVVPRSHVVFRDNSTGEEHIIGTFNGTTMEPTNALSTTCLRDLNYAVNVSTSWIGMDELGYLESAHPAFQQAVLHAFDTKQVLAVVRKQDTEFLTQILRRRDVYVVDLEKTQLKVGCVIMASGLSKRFGSNKLLTEFEGKTLLQHTLDNTDNLFDKRIVVTRSNEVAEVCAAQKVETILHALPYRSDTVRLGTSAMPDMDAIVFCPCDQPRITRESLKAMLDYPYLHDDMILRMAWEDQHGTPILIGAPYFAALQQLPNGKGGGYLAGQHPENVYPVYVNSPWELFDIDTPEDFEKLKKAPVL